MAEANAREALSCESSSAYLFGCFGSRLEAHWVHAIALHRLDRQRDALDAASHARLMLTWLAEDLPLVPRASPLYRAIDEGRLDTPAGFSWRD